MLSGRTLKRHLLMGVAATLTLQAAVDPKLLTTMHWRNIGPFRGGRTVAVAGITTQPRVYYMGATGGGVWKTVDAGITWTNISDGYFKTGSVGAIAVSESDPNIVYVGMGEACLRANISHGDGVYKSSDGGKTWTNVGLRDTRHIGRIRISPTDPNLVYVAAVGHAWGPNTERGVFRSRDGGKSWQRVLFVNENTGAVDIDMSPGDPRVLYAAMWQVVRHPWGITSVGPGSGIYKSTDSGDTWTELADGLPKGEKGKIGIAISPVNTNRVWATVENPDGGGIFRSDDAGQHWQLLNDHFEVRGRQYYYGHIFADTQELDTVYTFSSKGFFKSTDGGVTYSTINTPHSDYHGLWIDPHNHLRMANASDGGVSITFDGGQSWSSLDNQPTAQFYEVATDSHFPYRVYGSQQDNTTVSIASRTDSGGIGLSDWYIVAGGESGYIAPSPENPDITYAGSYFGMMTRYNHATNETRNISVWPDYPGGRTAAQMKYRFQWTYPIVISKLDPKTIYAGANVLFRSTDEGQSWEKISPDLTKNDKAKESGGRLEEFYDTIFAIAPSPKEKNVIWTGSDDGLVHLTQDGGKTWQNVTPASLPEWSRINIIEASTHDPASAYIAVNRYQLDDFRPYLYRTSDFGKSWKLITEGIPQDTFTRTIREDPVRPNLLYGGTETGVYVSWDNGDHWQPLQRNLPIVPITDLTVEDDDLIAATQGRAFWILGNLAVLRQMNANFAPDAPHLFHPADVYRPGRRSVAPGVKTPGENPPRGVLVDYYLPEKNSGPITLEFDDSDGKVIKSFSKIPAEAGMNQFEWDLRYPDADGIKGGTHLAGGNTRGPVAIPGSYRVKLMAGTELAASFKILKDPRLPTTEEGYRKQFDLLMSVRNQLTLADDAYNQISADENTLKSRNDPNAAKGIAALDEIAHELVESRFIGYDDQMLVFPLKLNNRIAALQGYVEGGYAPTDQDYQVYNELSADLEEILSRLHHVRESYSLGRTATQPANRGSQQ